jgi:AcrR family transcriptional regulator
MHSPAKKSRSLAGATSQRVANKRVASNTDQNSGTAPSSMREEVTAYRKDLIVKAASDAFYEHGYHDCTVDMIAERLSGTKALVYYYFSDKRSILGEIFRRALIDAQEVIRTAIDVGNDPREKLEAFARMYASWVIDNQRIVAILWREERSISQATRDLVASERRTMDDLVALIVREGVSKGQFRVDDVRTTARAISGMISYIYSWWRNDRRLTKDDLADYYAQIVLRIVGAPAEPGHA